MSNADQLKDGLRQNNERSGPFFKMTSDPRVTRFGRILRRYSLDELPQLWNVMRGEMSLVGPRPHPLDDVAGYAIEHLGRLDVTPGITGLWKLRPVAIHLFIEAWSWIASISADGVWASTCASCCEHFARCCAEMANDGLVLRGCIAA